MNNLPHDEGHALAIDLPDLSSRNRVFSVRVGGLFVGFHGGDIPPALWTSSKLS
jgi:hypothetical protein